MIIWEEFRNSAVRLSLSINISPLIPGYSCRYIYKGYVTIFSGSLKGLKDIWKPKKNGPVLLLNALRVKISDLDCRGPRWK